jgi:UDP-3-O-acyl N-acetylglucosamine deacetylase
MLRHTADATKKTALRKGRIVVVDDEENIRSAVKDILTDEGYEVDCAPDGETALRMIQSNAPDLVLLDIWMPGLDGLQTLKILKNMESDAEVVMMSGHGAIETAVKATKLGAFDFIEKPFSLESILRTVGKALRNRRLRSKKNRLILRQPAMVDRFMGSSRGAEEARRMIRSVAQGTRPVLLAAEAGLGKRFAARMIHALSDTSDRPFAEVVCGSLLSADIEDLWRGIVLEQEPKDEQGPPGAILFEGLDALAPELCGRLAELIRSVGREPDAGSPRTRIMVTFEVKGNFAPEGEVFAALTDVGTVTLTLAPLRERKGDIPELVEKFVDDFCEEYGKSVETVDDKAMERFVSMPWRGNVKELKEAVGRAVSFCDGPELTFEAAKRAIEGEAAALAFPSQAGIRVYGHGSMIPPRSAAAKGRARERHGHLRQRTLKNSVVLRGLGLHSGIKTGMILSPLPPDSGIVFGDISTGLRVPALLENVRSTEYATTLSNGSVTIKTIEHIMSALHSYRITNLLIKIGDEAPIMDGSALDFCQIIEDSGIEEQDGFIEEITLDEPVSVGDEEGGPSIRVEPAPILSIHYYLDYPAPIGVQEYEYVHQSGEHYKETIAPARTFGFLKDIKKLEEAGLAGGGKLSNVVLIDDEKVINTPLRFPDEPARHKILDLIGDLYLLGRPIQGRIIARKSGHTQNIALISKISERLNIPRALK